MHTFQEGAVTFFISNYIERERNKETSFVAEVLQWTSGWLCIFQHLLLSVWVIFVIRFSFQVAAVNLSSNFQLVWTNLLQKCSFQMQSGHFIKLLLQSLQRQRWFISVQLLLCDWKEHDVSDSGLRPKVKNKRSRVWFCVERRNRKRV